MLALERSRLVDAGSALVEVSAEIVFDTLDFYGGVVSAHSEAEEKSVGFTEIVNVEHDWNEMHEMLRVTN